MPDVNFFEQNDIPIEEVRRLLDQMQSVEAVADHYGKSPRTVTRFIKGKLERRFCWHPIAQTIDITAQPSSPTARSDT